MTRAKAAQICQAIKFILDREDYSEEVEEALNMAIEALEQEETLQNLTKPNKSDLISRQVAIDALNTGWWGVEWDKALATAMLKDLPSAQPEITRCKDCEHWTNDDCPFAWGKVEDAFCSYAERRTDG